MADATAEDVAFTLLRALPAEVVDALLTRLGGPDAERLRARLAAPAEPTPPAALDAALDQFFDLQRIADRPPPPAPAAEPAAPVTPAAVSELRTLPPDLLARALDGEPPAATAVVLGCLDPGVVAQVLRRLPADARADLAVRLGRPGARNPDLLHRLAGAVAEKARRLASVPAEPTAEERVAALADILRSLPRADRVPVLRRLEAADAETAAGVREKLYRLDDLLRVPDRQLQVLLTEVEVKKLALALKDSSAEIQAKVNANLSTRARAALAEEAGLLAGTTASAAREARTELLGVLQRLEEEGRVTIEE